MAPGSACAVTAQGHSTIASHAMKHQSTQRSSRPALEECDGSVSSEADAALLCPASRRSRAARVACDSVLGRIAIICFMFRRPRRSSPSDCSPFSATVPSQNRRGNQREFGVKARTNLRVHFERVVRRRFSDDARQSRAGTLGGIACRISRILTAAAVA
jgi:hypothetical protein